MKLNIIDFDALFVSFRGYYQHCKRFNCISSSLCVWKLKNPFIDIVGEKTIKVFYALKFYEWINVSGALWKQ